MVMLTRPEDLLGEVLDGRYRLEAILGSGGMGVVFRARHLRLGGEVAIKMLNPYFLSDERQRERFLQEAQTAHQLESLHIVKIMDFGDSPSAYFVMELLKGEDLEDHIDRHGRLPWRRALHITRQVLLALSDAHARGVIHRDLKPSNIFLTRPGSSTEVVKVVDFGIAKLAHGTKKLTGVDEVLGTVPYMAPEQAQSLPIDGRSDLYALGAALFQMLTGSVPFTGRTMFEVIQQHITAPAPAPSTLVPSLNSAIDRLVLCALEKDPGRRYPTADHFRTAVDQILAESRIPAATSSPAIHIAATPRVHPTTIVATPPTSPDPRSNNSPSSPTHTESKPLAAPVVPERNQYRLGPQQTHEPDERKRTIHSALILTTAFFRTRRTQLASIAVPTALTVSAILIGPALWPTSKADSLALSPSIPHHSISSSALLQRDTFPPSTPKRPVDRRSDIDIELVLDDTLELVVGKPDNHGLLVDDADEPDDPLELVLDDTNKPNDALELVVDDVDNEQPIDGNTDKHDDAHGSTDDKHGPTDDNSASRKAYDPFLEVDKRASRSTPPAPKHRRELADDTQQTSRLSQPRRTKQPNTSAAARAALLAGDTQQALRLSQAQLAKSPDSATAALVVLAACRLDRPNDARKALRHLDGTRRQDALRVCAQQGVRLKP